MADDDLDYSDTNVGSAQSQGVRKNISLKLKGKARSGRGKRGGRGRRSTSSKKIVIGNDDDDEETPAVENPTPGDVSVDKQISDIGLDEVICKLETPSFSPMDRAFPEPLHQNKPLRWNHKVNLIGEKVVNPLIHRCEQCGFPILNYGRMIPCKHIFCYGCAKKADKICPKCNDKVQRVEQTSLGTVFMCTFGGSRLGPVACGRTYLSQRDLQAHINHRHLKPASTSASTASAQSSTSHSSASVSLSATSHIPLARDPRDPRGHISMDVPHSTAVVSHNQHGHGLSDHREQSDHPLINSAMSAATIPAGNPSNQQRQYPHSPANYPNVVPVSSARPNLITVPIQDDSSGGAGQHVHSQQSHTPQYTPPGATAGHPPPPIQHPTSSYPPPPPHPYQHPIPAPAPAYSQAPPMTTQTFTAHPPPPSVHHPPPMHGTNAPGSMYSTPPPVHHPPPPVTYSAPQGSAPPHSAHTLPPQRFTNPAAYDEPYNIQPWNASNVPPPARGPLPPRPIAAPPSAGNHPHMPSRGPSDPNFRPQYYQ